MERSDDLDFDPEALRARYRAERDKRLRPDGAHQFTKAEGDLSHFKDDPHVEPGFSRVPLADTVDVLIVGAGFGGLLLGAHLRKAGVESIRIVDRAGGFGGTWYWNRYPGAACDTESYIYLPMLEELGYMPSGKYAKAPEIHAHCLRMARHFGLDRDTLFQTEVTGLSWEEASSHWIVSTNRGDAIRARFVAASPGPMDRPKLAGIAGIETFGGHAFHTSRWDYGYTGGNSDGGLTGLADKRVGIIGTGATAVQCIPHLAASAEQLFVFQRTPSSIDVRGDRPTDPDWAASLEPGWQQKRLENFTILTTGGRAEENLTNDGWTGIYRNVQRLVTERRALGEEIGDLGALATLGDYMKMEEVRRRVDEVVMAPTTAEALKPWYDQFCKRPCFHDDYLTVFNRPNVTLVDTGGRGVDRITPNGAVVDDVEYPLDCLIYSTGFEVGAPLADRLGFTVQGRDRATLAAHWSDGARTLHGVMTHGFPNLFFMSHVQTGLSLNFPHMINEQAQHVAYIVGHALASGARAVEPTVAAEDHWVAEVERTAPQIEAFQRECTPSYFNFEGDVKRRNARNSPYGGGPMAFYRILEDWRAEGRLAGLELR